LFGWFICFGFFLGGGWGFFLAEVITKVISKPWFSWYTSDTCRCYCMCLMSPLWCQTCIWISFLLAGNYSVGSKDFEKVWTKYFNQSWKLVFRSLN